MTVIEELCKYFELYLFELRHARMSPPNNRKEPTMRNLNLDDVSAVSRAESGMYPMLVPNMSPFHRQKIEDDLERLAFVKRFLLKAIYEPGLQTSNKTPEIPL